MAATVMTKEQEDSVSKVGKFSSLNLSLDVEDVKQGLLPAAPEKKDEAGSEEDQKADAFVDMLLEVTDEKLQVERENYRNSVETMGVDIQKKSSHRSKMLDQPIKTLAERGDDGGPVAKALLDLKDEVEELDPNKFDFSDRGLSKLLSFLPFVGKKIRRYFDKYRSAESVINEIVLALKEGAEMLRRDNITLGEDQKEMRKLTLALQNQIKLGMLISDKLDYRLQREEMTEEKKTFLQNEIQFPLSQRVQDLQQQLAVNQQGVLTCEIIIRNNKELIRGVNRALDVTVSALRVAVAAALALANQKLVLDKIEMLNATTSNIIAGTAERLRTQGVAIHNQASSTMLDMNLMKQAFTDIFQAMDDISTYRQAAIPKLKENISAMAELTLKGEETIQKMEKGNIESSKVANLNI